MLNPANNRLEYGDIMIPPREYALSFAVGTTYSLDLDALVGASLPLSGLSGETDSAILKNPVFLLEALRRTGDKVALFCESGQIHTPGKPTELYILLEKMVSCVAMPERTDAALSPSFHPKFWLIRFENEKRNVSYRVAVLSRNLTFDRSWDVAYSMDGDMKEERTDKNEPVCDFLRFLSENTPSGAGWEEKRDMIRTMIRELPYADFKPQEREFDGFQFYPGGIKRADGRLWRFDETPLFTDTYHEMLAISPFVSRGIIRDFNNRNDKSHMDSARLMLITREASLGKLKPEDVTHFRLYTLKDGVVDGEAAISEDGSDVQRQDIHAKVYLTRKYSQTDLYLGSLNASHNAVYGNVEFMICLRAKNRYLNMDKLIASLFGNDPDGPDNPFQEVSLKEAAEPEEDPERALKAEIRRAVRSGPSASAEEEGEGRYRMRVRFPEAAGPTVQLCIRPLLSNRKEAFAREIVFTGLGLTQLSTFFVIEASDGERTVSRVFLIPTEGLPDRERAVVSGTVKDRECFCRYVAFLLGDDAVLSALETDGADGLSGGAARRTGELPALYEKMLAAAAEAPQKFEGIDYLMKAVSDGGIIPDGFRALYEKFVKVVRRNG